MNTRWNSTTDFFEVLKNGTWTQSIRAYVNSIKLYYDGVFGAVYENGVYTCNSQYTLNGGFSLPPQYLTVAYPTSNLGCRTLVFSDVIDLTQYSSIKVSTSIGDLTCDISNVNRSAYICLNYRQYSPSSYAGFAIMATTQKNQFGESQSTILASKDSSNVFSTKPTVTIYSLIIE